MGQYLITSTCHTSKGHSSCIWAHTNLSHTMTNTHNATCCRIGWVLRLSLSSYNYTILSVQMSISVSQVLWMVEISSISNTVYLYKIFFLFLFSFYDDRVMEISIYSLKGGHHLAHSDLCASSSLLPESKSHIRIFPHLGPFHNISIPPPWNWNLVAHT